MGAIEAITMSFKIPTGKKLDSMLDKLSAKDIKEIRTQFEFDVQNEDQKETDMPMLDSGFNGEREMK